MSADELAHALAEIQNLTSERSEVLGKFHLHLTHARENLEKVNACDRRLAVLRSQVEQHLAARAAEKGVPA